jgi:5'-methylthioadenosine phosphorylase
VSVQDRNAALRFPHEREPCPIGSESARDTAPITAPGARDKKLMKRLNPAMGRVPAKTPMPR